MKHNGKQLRHELKYFINPHEYWILRNRLKTALYVDKHGDETNSYHIRSLYFDDMYQSALLEKQSGVNIRYKYRIRIYNESDAVIKLERKHKINQFIHKEDISLSREDFDNILKGEVEWMRGKEDKLASDFYRAYKDKYLRPRVIVDYDREAYTYPQGNVRITFDKDLRAGINSSNIFEPHLVTRKILTNDTMILEVKYDDYIPMHVKNLLQIATHTHSAASKYVMCTKAISNIKY